MRIEGEEAIQVIETGIVIEIEESESGTDTENGTQAVKGTEIGMGEVGMEDEGWIGDPEMEEMELGTGTRIGAGHAPLLGMDTGGHLEVQFTHISEM